MKILAVCGFGVGSSMILSMSIQKVCKKLQVEADVENTDISSARGTLCDAIFTSAELAEELRGSCDIPVIAIKKYMDLVEVEEAMKAFLKEKS